MGIRNQVQLTRNPESTAWNPESKTVLGYLTSGETKPDQQLEVTFIKNCSSIPLCSYSITYPTRQRVSSSSVIRASELKVEGCEFDYHLGLGIFSKLSDLIEPKAHWKLFKAPCKRTQRCWMLLVASVCTPCCMLLCKV